MTILVIGGGIGGLTLALSMHQIGVPVCVFESAPDLQPLGVGINILPHAVRELMDLGLEDRLIESRAVATRELAYFNRHGQKIWTEPRGREAGYHWPQFSIHRGRLQMALADAVKTRLGDQCIQTSHRLRAFRETATGVGADFVDPSTGKSQGEFEGDLLVAADGIHSTVRAQLYPDEGAPIWNGAILWRGTSRAPPFLSGRTMIMAGHERQKFVCYPIAAADKDGVAEINWVAERKFDPAAGWRREDYHRAGKLDEFLPWFESWQFDWLDVPTIIRGASAVFEYPMVDRDPLEQWTFGRVTLLGDAAHPMYPIGSNGASQAILDARILAREMQTNGTTQAALESYEGERRPATSKIVLANRGNGPEQVMQLVEERAPDGFRALHDVITERELEEIAANYKRLAGFDLDILNNRPPLVSV